MMGHAVLLRQEKLQGHHIHTHTSLLPPTYLPLKRTGAGNSSPNFNQSDTPNSHLHSNVPNQRIQPYPPSQLLPVFFTQLFKGPI